MLNRVDGVWLNERYEEALKNHNNKQLKKRNGTLILKEEVRRLFENLAITSS